MTNNQWFIQDWAGNRLDSYDFKYRRKDLVNKLMVFGSFDDAEEWLSEKLGDNYETDRGEYYIERLGKLL